MKIKTKDLKAMVSKVQKGFVVNGIVPITGLINIKNDGNDFYLRTTDGSYHYRARLAGLGGEAMSVCVNASLFVSLVSKTTVDEVELSVDEGSLRFKGNGSYKLEVVYDGGSPLDFPSLDEYDGAVFEGSVKREALSDAFASCEVTMAKSMEKFPKFSGMNVGDSFVSTNNAVACVHEGECAVASPFLIPYPALRFIASFSEETIQFAIKDDEANPLFRMSDGSFDVFGPLAVKYREFPSKALKQMLAAPLKKAGFDVADAIGAVDRIDLFSKQYDSSVIALSFKDGELTLECLNNDSKALPDIYETLRLFEVGADGAVTDKDAFFEGEFRCEVGIQYLQSELKALKGDKAVVGFGSDRFITLSGASDLFMLSFAKRAQSK